VGLRGLSEKLQISFSFEPRSPAVRFIDKHIQACFSRKPRAGMMVAPSNLKNWGFCWPSYTTAPFYGRNSIGLYNYFFISL